jgi:hypothetical protein
MDHTPHVFLSGPEAEEFAASQGHLLVANETFTTPQRREQWERYRNEQVGPTSGGAAGDILGTPHQGIFWGRPIRGYSGDAPSGDILGTPHQGIFWGRRIRGYSGDVQVSRSGLSCCLLHVQ